MKHIESQIKTNYEYSLSNLASTINNLFDGIYQSNYLLALDPNFLKIFTTEYAEDDLTKYADYTQAIRSLSRVKSSSNYIDSAYIYKRKEDIIISDNGTYLPEQFYQNLFDTKQYPPAFWHDFKANHHLFTILPPSQTSGNDRNQKESTISVVQSTVGGRYSNNLYIINLKAEAVRNLLRSYKLTPNSLIMVSDPSGNLLAASQIIDSDLHAFMSETLTDPHEKFDMTYQNQQMHVIKYSTNFFFRDATMIVAVPHSDITSFLNKMKNWNFTVTGILFVISLLLSILFSKRFYAPIRSLVQTLQRSEHKKKEELPFNELEFLNTEIRRILMDVDQLNETLSYSLPIATQHFLGKMLKTSFPYDNKTIDDYLMKLGFRFPNRFFQIGLIQCTFRKPFYDLYSEKFQTEASDTVHRILQALLPKKHPTYILELDTNLFGVLINPASAIDIDSSSYFELIDTLFRQDEAALRIHIGMGLVHENYKGMQISYMEAMKALWRVSPFDSKRIVYYSEFDHEEPRFMLNKTEENILTNLLVAGKREELMEQLKQLIKANIDQSISGTSMKQLLIHLYLIGIQVLKQKNISFEQLAPFETSEFLLSADSGSVEEISGFLFGFFDRVLALSNPSPDTFNIQRFRAYLDTHYAEEITLDILADKYNTSPKYMSRLLKNELGTTFYRYLQELRIAKAKELLIASSDPIHKIWEQVGFNNRNTFIRTFRNLEGISPTDYRKYHQPESLSL
ncbi:helix-turn-helix domain-containing protein [Paenibacillus dendrobii]|nr:helix-turn-helix domain-containing protein [Paenibacillus dendrobii]